MNVALNFTSMPPMHSKKHCLVSLLSWEAWNPPWTPVREALARSTFMYSSPWSPSNTALPNAKYGLLSGS